MAATPETFIKELISYLLAKSAIADQIANRMYRARAPQNAHDPYVIVTKIGHDKIYCHDGDTELDSLRIQFDVVDDRAARASEITEIISEEISGKTISLPTTTLRAGFQQSAYDDFDSTSELNTAVIDFILTFDAA